MVPIVIALGLLAIWIAPAPAEPPPMVGQVDFEDTPTGVETHIAEDWYRSQGLLLGCTPGHWLHTVERRDKFYGRSLAVSPGGENLFISVEFVVPGTSRPGAVQATDILALDAARRGYDYEYFDIYGSPANSGHNQGDYRMGEGWSYTDGPVAHRFVFHLGTGEGIYLDNIRFSVIAAATTGVEPATWGAVRALYR